MTNWIFQLRSPTVKWVWTFLFLCLGVTRGEVIFQSSFEETSSPGSSSPQWSTPYLVEKSDPVFAGSDFSGIRGNWFALLSDMSVDLPTQGGEHYRLKFKYSSTDSNSYSSPPRTFTVKMAVEVLAYAGSHQEEYHGETVTVEDLETIKAEEKTLTTAGTHDWRMVAWHTAEVAFVAQTDVTRIRLRTLARPAESSYGAIDDVVVERVIVPAAETLSSTSVLKYQRELARLRTRLEKARQADRSPKVIRELKRKIRKTRLLFEENRGR